MAYRLDDLEPSHMGPFESFKAVEEKLQKFVLEENVKVKKGRAGEAEANPLEEKDESSSRYVEEEEGCNVYCFKHQIPCQYRLRGRRLPGPINLYPAISRLKTGKSDGTLCL
ncbi:hypothetical protein VNO80_26272 [Phaseolus coccineus]|uniref:Uncharacterized protein n=1 Tax=Phaseolus coccineus TaxID=3886 RepID=A0AAN9LEG0_PHACN